MKNISEFNFQDYSFWKDSDSDHIFTAKKLGNYMSHGLLLLMYTTNSPKPFSSAPPLTCYLPRLSPAICLIWISSLGALSRLQILLHTRPTGIKIQSPNMPNPAESWSHLMPKCAGRVFLLGFLFIVLVSCGWQVGWQCWLFSKQTEAFLCVHLCGLVHGLGDTIPSCVSPRENL